MHGCMPFFIDTNQNITRGYDERVCIQCSNGYDTVTQNNVNVIQTSKHAKNFGQVVESQMDFQALHTEAVSTVQTKTTHITLWIIMVILIAMMIALCVGFKMYKDQPAEVKTIEVIKYVKEPRRESEPQTPLGRQRQTPGRQPQSIKTVGEPVVAPFKTEE